MASKVNLGGGASNAAILMSSCYLALTNVWSETFWQHPQCHKYGQFFPSTTGVFTPQHSQRFKTQLFHWRWGEHRTRWSTRRMSARKKHSEWKGWTDLVERCNQWILCSWLKILCLPCVDRGRWHTAKKSHHRFVLFYAMGCLSPVPKFPTVNHSALK